MYMHTSGTVISLQVLNKIFLFLMETAVICQDVGRHGENPRVAAGEPVCLRPRLHRGGRQGGGKGARCTEFILTSSSHWSQTSRVRRQGTGRAGKYMLKL